jgi:hypothetical protein
MNTLRYANRAKKIKNKPIIKMDPREKLILTLKRELKILRQENHYLRQQVSAVEQQKVGMAGSTGLHSGSIQAYLGIASLRQTMDFTPGYIAERAVEPR